MSGRLAAVAAAVAVAVGMSGLTAVSHARADVVTVSTDTGRTGWDPNEPKLSPSAVNGSDFGQLYSTALIGQVYAQPLVVGSTLVAATEENHVYGLDSATGAIKWSVYFGPSWPASTVDCGDLVPDVGVTSTPVYDPSSGYVYLTAKVNDGTSPTNPHYYLHALDVNTGAERPGWPITIQGSPSNDPSNTFDTVDELQRPGLLLQNGSVYMAFSGHCDTQPYRGYVVGVNTSTQALHMWTAEAGPNASGAGIWQSGGGIVSDGNGGMFISTGNGVTPPPGPGTSPPATLSESVVHLGVAADGTISATDFFAPTEAGILDANDDDLASGGPVALPDAEFGTTADPHLMVVIGKEGKLYLLNRDSLGGRGQGPGGGDQVLGETMLTGVWGHPAVWGGDGGYVYLTESNGFLVALGYGQTASGTPALHVAGNSAETFGYTSGSPVVTSDGTTSGSALVWVVRSSDTGGDGGQLMVYNAVPSNHTLTLLRSWPLGTVTKFAVPATDGGHVYVGTRDGHLIAFGAPTDQALQSQPVAFGATAVGTAGTATAVLTATKTVTVSAITTDAPFAVAPPALPVTLTAGQTLSVPVTFSPATWGAATGQIQLTTDAGTIYAGLAGTGTQPGLAASPPSLDYGAMAVGSIKTVAVSVQNTGTTAETFAAVTAPSAPFTADGLPAVGDTLAPGAADTFSVTYSPSVVANDSSSVVLTSDQGTVTIPLTGAAQVANDQVTISPTSLAFGRLQIGQISAPQTFTVTNTGNLTLTITKAAPPAGAFTALNPIPEGQQLAPGESYTVSVTFTPFPPEDFTGTYEITTDTGQGPMNVSLTGTGVPGSGVPVTPPGGGWTLNGSAAMSGTNLALSPADTQQAGSAVYGIAVPSAGLTAGFTAQLNGGSAGDGLTFSLLDAAKSTATALGGADDGLGFSGLPGISVVLGTHWQWGALSDNYVGIATDGRFNTLRYLALSRRIPPLRTGTHTVSVQVAGDRLDVSVDGRLVLSPTVTLPASVLPAFTAGTGRSYANHVISGVTISSGSTSVPPPGGGWSYNGSAGMSGSDTALTPVAPDLAGSVTLANPLAIHAMQLNFTSVIGNGTGGNGLTFSLLDAASASSGAVGNSGDGLGVTGLPGVYVTLNTVTNGQAVSSASIATNPASGTAPSAYFTATNIPSLIGTHTWWVVFYQGVISVAMDGRIVLRGAVVIPSSVLPSFTAGTGASTDSHVVRDVFFEYR